MARPVTGTGGLGDARALRDNAKTAEDLRVALAVLLPLEQGLSLKQTADIIGRSVSVTCSMRTRFARVIGVLQVVPQHKQQLRNRANADLVLEAQELDEVLANAPLVVWSSFPGSSPPLKQSWASPWHCRAPTGCWLATAGANFAPIRVIPKAIRLHGMIGKKSSPSTWVKS